MKYISYDEKLVNDIERILVKKNLSNDNAGHDIFHFRRVLKNAIFICESEFVDCDMQVIHVASMLHDVHRVMSKDICEYIPPHQSIPVIENILDELKMSLTEEQKKMIFGCIKHHEDYKVTMRRDFPKELYIIQDADNLDAIGVTGFIRAIQYGAKLKEPFYDSDEDVTLNEGDYIEGSHLTKSTLRHMQHKLLRIPRFLKTKTAIEMSNQEMEDLNILIKKCEVAW